MDANGVRLGTATTHEINNAIGDRASRSYSAPMSVESDLGNVLSLERVRRERRVDAAARAIYRTWTVGMRDDACPDEYDNLPDAEKQFFRTLASEALHAAHNA